MRRLDELLGKLPWALLLLVLGLVNTAGAVYFAWVEQWHASVLICGWVGGLLIGSAVYQWICDDMEATIKVLLKAIGAHYGAVDEA